MTYSTRVGLFKTFPLKGGTENNTNLLCIARPLNETNSDYFHKTCTYFSSVWWRVEENGWYCREQMAFTSWRTAGWSNSTIFKRLIWKLFLKAQDLPSYCVKHFLHGSKCLQVATVFKMCDSIFISFESHERGAIKNHFSFCKENHFSRKIFSKDSWVVIFLCCCQIFVTKCFVTKCCIYTRVVNRSGNDVQLTLAWFYTDLGWATISTVPYELLRTWNTNFVFNCFVLALKYPKKHWLLLL